jgi:GNAT superfamily N-acetyltransferase
MNVEIRKATADDLDTLLAFEQGIIEFEKPFDPTLKEEHFNYYDLAAIIKNEASEVFVAKFDNKLVASGHVRIKNGEEFNAFEKYAFLGFMYVDPAYRGKGINQKITNALIEWAKERGLDEIRLKVYSENKSALKAYEKSGFKPFLTEMRIQ